MIAPHATSGRASTGDLPGDPAGAPPGTRRPPRPPLATATAAAIAARAATGSESGMLETFIPSRRRAVLATRGVQSLGSERGAVTGGTIVSPDRPVRNRLLGALSAEEYDRLRPHLEPVRFEQRQVLFEQEGTIRHVYFPETMVVSLVSSLRDGATVEVGTAGCEGMAGLPLFLGDDSSSVRAFAQIPGAAVRMDAETFVRVAAAPSAFHQMLLRYTQAFLTQVAQTAACNGAHLVEQRCARWLLMTHDRVQGDDFPLTHEFLAFMLGVRRAGVTVAMRTLQDAGLVRYTRGWVEVADRAGLEGASCECYRVVRAHFDRLLPQTASQ